MANTSSKPNVKKSLLLALYFQIAWVVLGLITYFAGGFVSPVLLILNMFTLWVPALLELITKTKIPTVLQLHYYVFISASSLLGSALNWYGIFLNWDTLVHIYSGTMLAWFGIFAVRVVGERAKATIPRWFAMIVGLATPLALASLWEIYEFMSDLLWHTTMQTGGLEDTIIDMVAALLGALVAVVLAIWFKVPKTVLPR